MLRLFTPIIEDSGVGFYRIFQPTKYLSDKKKMFLLSSEFSGSFQNRDIEAKLVEQGSTWGDAIFVNTAKDQRTLAMIMAMRDYAQKFLIIDVDDDLININPDNPSYPYYMNKDLNPSMYAQRSIMYADLVIVSTEYLKDFYSTLNKNIIVNPNSINLKLWKKSKGKNKKIRIGWSGAAGHTENLKSIEKPLKKILRKYDAEFVAFGEVDNSWKIGKKKKFVPLPKYPKEYAKLNFDIVIAPLKDNRYNRAKSNLRLIEAGALHIPIVASPTGPYKNFPCLYADSNEEWFNQLEKLIKSEKLRKEVGNKCFNEVKSKYNIEVTAPKLLKEFEKLKETSWKDRKFLTPQFSEQQIKI